MYTGMGCQLSAWRGQGEGFGTFTRLRSRIFFRRYPGGEIQQTKHSTRKGISMKGTGNLSQVILPLLRSRKATIPLAALLLFGIAVTARGQGTTVSYQGRVLDNGTNFSGTGQFKFALVASTNSNYITYWSNDGTSSAGSEPAVAVSVPVNDGLFTVLLGDTTLANMTAMDAALFLQPNLQLRIWFSDGVSGWAALSPLQNLAAAPYAAFANAASNLNGTLPVSQLSGTVPNSQLANNSVSVNAGTGLSGGGTVPLGGATTLSNAGVLSVTGNADITASTVNGAVMLGDTGTAANTPSTLVKRDASGNFAAGTITANLAGNADTVTHGVYDNGTYADPSWITALAGDKITGDVSGKAAGFTGPLAGDVTGTQGATVVSSVGGQTAASVASGASAANAATSAATPNTIVQRDATGSFAVTNITVRGTLTGDGSGLVNLSAANVSGTLANSQLANSSVIVNAGTGLSGGGLVALGGTTTLNNAGVLSVTGNADITATTINGAVTLGDTATAVNTPSTLIKRDASGDFSAGTITASLAGNATSATTANGFSGSLAGDVTGPQGATVVSGVGGQSAANVASGVSAANGAASANTPSTLVKRDSSGNFSAGIITANLAGNAETVTHGIYDNGAYADPAWITALAGTKITGDVSGKAAGFTGSLEGDVTGSQGATVVSTVGGESAANVASGASAANAATSLATPNTIVERDATGSFVATNITANGTIAGNGEGLTNLNAANVSGALANSQLANSSVIVNAGTGLSGGGLVALGGTTTLNNAGVLSVTGNADITATTINGAVTLGDTATAVNTPSTLIKRDSSGNFSAGIITANLAGNAETVTHGIYDNGAYADPAWITALAGTKITGDVSGKAAGFTGSLAGDVTGSQGATVVSTVGGQNAANVASGASAANAATSLATPDTIVQRDATGSFSVTNITVSGTLTGNGSGLTQLNPANLSPGNAPINISGMAATATTAATATSANYFSGSLAGDVTGTQGATVVSSVGGQSSANVASGASAANAATSAGTFNTIVKRDGSGNFAAGTITGNLSGNAATVTHGVYDNGAYADPGWITSLAGTKIAGNINGNAAGFTGPLTGDVTGTQGATVVSSVGGQAAVNVAGGVSAANAATSANTASTIAKRDASGNFSAGSVTLAGSLNLPTTSASAGIINVGGSRLFHAYGVRNTFAGFDAGNFTLGGSDNTAYGYQASFWDTSGSHNTADGVYALYNNTSGSYNSAIGGEALVANTYGSYNTAIGNQTLYYNTGGSGNIALGHLAGANIVNGNYNIDIGASGPSDESNTIRIGTPGTHTQTFIAGNTVNTPGLTRSGSGTGTSEAPYPAGMVVRRINSTSPSVGQVVAVVRNQTDTANITLERDGTSGGFLIRYPASPGRVTIAAMGMDASGTQRNFYYTLSNPDVGAWVTIYNDGAEVVHFECTFGITYFSGQHLTQVNLSRFAGDYYWSGTLMSTYNQ
jgi:trimeric autotransporter adhesin